MPGVSHSRRPDETMWISPKSFGKARVVSHVVDAGATLAAATLAAAMDLLRVAAFVGAFVGAFIDDAVGAACCNAVLAEAFCNAAARGTARPPDVLNGAARVDLQRGATFDVAKAARAEALEYMAARTL